MWHEIAGDMRSIVTEGIVLAVSDAGLAQTIDVQLFDGTICSGIEVHQTAGFASSPIVGGKAVLLGMGGDIANLRALPVSDGWRYGSQAAGERTIYAPDGTRVSVRLGGIVEIWAGNTVKINAPNMTVVAPQGVAITGDVTITGNLLVSGDITDQNDAHGSVRQLRTAYDAHTHHENGEGSQTGTTSQPV